MNCRLADDVKSLRLLCDEHVINECRRRRTYMAVGGLTDGAASKQGEALAALREGSTVLGPKPLGQNDDDQRREVRIESRKTG
jgi:hypothetical protein